MERIAVYKNPRTVKAPAKSQKKSTKSQLAVKEKKGRHLIDCYSTFLFLFSCFSCLWSSTHSRTRPECQVLRSNFIQLTRYAHRLLVLKFYIREVLQNEFRYDFRKGRREISAGTAFTVFTCIIAFTTVITVPAEISRGPFRKSYRNSFCKTSLMWTCASMTWHWIEQFHVAGSLLSLKIFIVRFLEWKKMIERIASQLVLSTRTCFECFCWFSVS